jgi:hypothetical protein
MDGSEREIFPDYVIDAVRTSEVLCIFFPYAMRSWIIDTRRTAGSDPKVVVDGMVGSPAARVESFRRLRPELPLPTTIALVPWIGYARQLALTGVLDAIYERCRWEVGDELAADAERCYNAIQHAEDEIKRQVVRGIGMRAIWQRPRS